MSQTVKLSSKLPGDGETNGLDAFAADLIESRGSHLICIAWVTCHEYRVSEDDLKIPTAVLERIEPLGFAGQVPQGIVDVALKAAEQRTGHTPLPFETTTVDEQLPEGPEWGDEQ